MKTTRLLGFAFLLQFVISLAAYVTQLLLEKNVIVAGDMGQSLVNMAGNDWLLKANILGEMLTTLTIIFLGSLLFDMLKKQHERLALTGLGFYILGAAILAGSRFATFSLLSISSEYVEAGQPVHLLIAGTQAWNAMNFGTSLLMLPFTAGAGIFFLLFYRSRIIPRFLALWGLAFMLIMLIASPLTLFGYELPVILYLLYAPVDPIVGTWLLVKKPNDLTT
jgi:hypothetical protein